MVLAVSWFDLIRLQEVAEGVCGAWVVSGLVWALKAMFTAFK